MNETLKQFTQESLFDATSALLSKLNIYFDRETAQPIDVTQLHEPPVPKYFTNALQHIQCTYFIGIVNDLSLQGNKSADRLEDALARMKERGDKYDGMFVFACDAKPDADLTRSDAAALTRGFNRLARANPVILVIRQNNLLSLASSKRMDYDQHWRQKIGERIGTVNILRNINCDAPHRGHINILNSLGEKQFTTFEGLYNHWFTTFSNELLTKKFYTELSDWFAWAVKVCRFPNDLSTRDDDDKFNHEACIRLITRLIFVWFLKEKELIPEEFFNQEYIRENLISGFSPTGRKTAQYDPEQSKYYRLILQNLFFAMLNRPIVAEGKTTPNNRRFMKESFQGKNSDHNINNIMRYKKDFTEGGAEKFIKLANSNVPFLNGGLFECLDNKSRKMYYDGFSEKQESLEQLYLPDFLFFGTEDGCRVDLSKWYGDMNKKNATVRGLIDILKRYSFTIEENTPLDQEVSLDPELLGKVFENLLAAYNPETQKSARKQTGSFYTPREIVQYMVDESLVAHLKRMCGDELEPKYRDLLSYGSDEVKLTEEQRWSIMSAIYNCRVLDPACGSGAFPMGILQQMVHVIKRIDPSNEMWNKMIMDIALEETRKELEKVAKGTEEERHKAEENRKARLEDIEGAFNRRINYPDYARKLYLIEHCIYGVDIQPIAIQISKLRFFISLVVNQKTTKDPKTNFGIRPLPNLESKFVTANTLIPLDRSRSLFTSTDDTRFYEEMLHDLNHRIFLAKRDKDKQELQKQMIDVRRMMAQTLENLHVIGGDGYTQLTKWDMFDQNASASFFDPEWMFGIKDGFDVVIGNPPYIQLQANGGELSKMYHNRGYLTFDSGGDIYQLFYEQGSKLLCADGHLCYITSNKWMRAGYGAKTRGYFTSVVTPLVLINFGGVQIFESASVDTNILLLQKSNKKDAVFCYSFSNNNKIGSNDIHAFLSDKLKEYHFVGDEMWTILSEQEETIKSKICQKGIPLANWNVEISRGILTGYNKAFIVTSQQKNDILLKCSSESEKERTEQLFVPILRGKDVKKQYTWAGLWLINTHNGVRGKKERIHIENYPAVKSFLDMFWDKISKRSDKGDTPYNLRNCAYLDNFEKPKVIYPETTQGAYFVYDEDGMYIDKTCFMLISEHAKYLQMTLSSKLFEFAYKRIFSSIELGAFGYQYNKHALLKLPVCKPIDNEWAQTEDKDDYIFKLYDINDDEKAFILKELENS